VGFVKDDATKVNIKDRLGLAAFVCGRSSRIALLFAKATGIFGCQGIRQNVDTSGLDFRKKVAAIGTFL
jgi:hypothetical protein